MPLRERAVARQRLLARDAAFVHRAQLARAREAEVQRRADPLGGEWETVPGGVAGEEHAVLDRGPQLVGDPVALIALAAAVPARPASLTVGSLTWLAGQNEPAPIRSSSRAGKLHA